MASSPPDLPPDLPDVAGDAGSLRTAGVLARVVRHEMLGSVRVQQQLLRAARDAHPDDGDLVLATAVADEMAGVLDALAVLAGVGAPAAPRPVRLASVLLPLVVHHRVPARCSAPALRSLVGPGTTPVLRNLLANAAVHAPDRVRLTSRRRGGSVQVRLHQSGPRPTEVVRALSHPHEPPAGAHGLGLWLVGLLSREAGVRVRTGSGPGALWTTTVEVAVAPACRHRAEPDGRGGRGEHGQRPETDGSGVGRDGGEADDVGEQDGGSCRGCA